MASKVVVLGCGPSGLAAAAAAEASGREVLVLSRRRKSQLWGCQYLHGEVPGFTDHKPVEVNYVLDGPAEGYLDKVYGEDYDGTVSPQEMTEWHQAWDIRSVYDRLWAHFSERVVDVTVPDGKAAAEWLPDFFRAGDMVVSTIPRPLLCADRKHNFASQSVWAMGDSPDQRVPVRPPRTNMVICNGHSDVGWYRTSEVFGMATVEWPWRDGRKPPFSGVAMVEKPLTTDCSCLPEVYYAGRYGAWRKGVLVHQVYWEIRGLLDSPMQERLF